jgi:Glutathione S-transferase, N-terminal domain
MTVRLHRCRNEWVKIGGHPCWKVEKALQEAGIEYEIVPGPVRRAKRDEMEAHTGQRLYPAIELEDGTWYREQSSEMARAIREGRLHEQPGGGATSAAPG